jgi:hypothetical protein
MVAGLIWATRSTSSAFRSASSRHGNGLPVDHRSTERWSAQCQPFNHLLDFDGHAPTLTLICARVKRQTNQIFLAIGSHPTL